MDRAIAHIGKVPRTPVVEIEGMGGPPAVAGVDFDYVDPRAPFHLERIARDYLVEHCIPAGGDPARVAQALRDWLIVLGPERDVTTLNRADGRAVIEAILARGNKPATARRIVTVGAAALNHAKREERIIKVPKFQMPAVSSPRMRVLTDEEERRLMLLPKPARVHKFYVIAFATGARSEAIEQLSWDRVDFERRTIDFRVPGAVYRNKRRVVVPMSDKLYVRLLNWFNAPGRDDLVIGRGPSGRVTSTYHYAKAALRAIGINEDGIARHVARHTVATRLIQQDTEIAKVARMLGDTVAMVERTYAHLRPDDLMVAANGL